MQRPRIDLQILDAGLLGRFPQRGGGEPGVTVLAVPTELHPTPDPRMQGQQHVRAIVREHHGRCGEVAGNARSSAGVRTGC
jgi:hypothetical protein